VRGAGQNVALLAVGGALLWITLAGHEYLNYVRPGFWGLLVAAGVLLCALGGLGIAGTWRHTAADDAHDHAHHGGSRTAWLLLVPPLVIAAIAPPALGSFTAARSLNQAPPPQAGHDLAALPATAPARISLTEFTARAFQAKAGHDTLTGRQVILTGFAHPAGPNRWLLIRLRMTCCAADAVPMRAAITNTPAPPAGTWVQVTGTWSPTWATIDHIDTPQLTATGLQRITKPTDPYE
jgi:uncharacterized repeat protein (TIGR03943 family)